MKRLLSLALSTVVAALASCTSPLERYEMGNTAYLRGNYPEALNHYIAARHADPGLAGIDEKIQKTEVAIRIEEGDRALRSRSWAVAERCYHEAERLDPGNEEVRERLLRLASTRANFHFQRGQELMARGDPFGAVAELESALTFQPDHPRAAEALRRARAEKERRVAGAETAFQEGLRAWSDRQHEAALQHFRLAVDLDPHHAGARRELETAEKRIAAFLVEEGDRHGEAGHWEQALTAYERARDFDTGQVGLHARIERAEREIRAARLAGEGDLAFARGEWRTALARYLEARGLTDSPESFRARFEEVRQRLASGDYARARAAEDGRRFDEALTIYESMREYFPDYRDVEARCEHLGAMLRTARVEYEAGCRAQDARDLVAARGHFLACGEAIAGYADIDVRLEALREELERAADLYERAVGAETRGELVRGKILFEECLSVASPFRDAHERISAIEATLAAEANARDLYREACHAQDGRDLERAAQLFRASQQARPGFRDSPERLRRVEAELATALEILDRAKHAEARCELRRAKVLYEECLAISSPCADAGPRLQRVESALAHLREARELERQRRLIAARRRYDQVTRHYEQHEDARGRAREIDDLSGELRTRYRALVEAQKAGKYRLALSIATEIRERCVDFEDVEERVPTLELEVDYANGCRLQRERKFEEAERCFARCAEHRPGFRDVDRRLHDSRMRLISDEPRHEN